MQRSIGIVLLLLMFLFVIFYRPFPSVILKKHKDSLSRLALCFDFVVFIFLPYITSLMLFLVYHLFPLLSSELTKNRNSGNLGRKYGVKGEIYQPYH